MVDMKRRGPIDLDQQAGSQGLAPHALTDARGEDGDRSQIVERLAWTPKERLDYLMDMLAFEERARRARRV